MGAQEDGLPLEGVAEVDEQWQVAYANPVLCERIGRPLDQLLGLRLASFFTPAFEIEMAEFCSRHRGTAGVMEASFLQAGKGPALATLTPFFKPDGRFDGAVCFFALGQSGGHSTRDLLWSERRLSALLEVSREVLVIADERARIIHVNAAAKRALGYDDVELLGKSKDILLPAHENDRSNGDLEAWLRAPGLPVPYSRQLLHKDGSLRSFEGVAINLLAHPHIRGLVLSLTDVTERELLRKRMQEARHLEGIGRLAGGVAHDFNNILTVVLGQVELLESRNSDDARLGRGLAEIRQAADRATGLVAQLLAFARRSVAAPLALDLGRSLPSMRHMLEGFLGPGIKLSIDLSPGLSSILADPLQVEQVLLNLAANARDAMPAGGELRIACQAASVNAGQRAGYPELRSGAYVRMEVTDTGQGMDAVTLEHAFEPFFTTKPSGRGTGMGLATCYGIVRQAGGHIEAHSRPGQGCRFDIYWPVDPGGAQPNAQAPAASGAAPRGVGELVLVVDDEAQVLELVAEGLTSLGYKVQHFNAPKDALAWLAAGGQPQLLITDMVMPEMGGEALAGRVHAHAPALPVLYISGYAATAVAKQSWLKQGVNFLPKPFGLPDLAQAVRRLLEGAR